MRKRTKEDASPSVPASVRAPVAKRKPRAKSTAVKAAVPRKAVHVSSPTAPAPSGDSNRVRKAASRRDRPSSVAHTSSVSAAPPSTIDQVIEKWRLRVDLHRAEKKLTLQIKAICRRVLVASDKDTAAERKSLYAAIFGKRQTKHALGLSVLATRRALIEGHKQIEAERLAVEEQLSEMVTSLPISPWFFSHGKNGKGGPKALSLAALVGEAGDITRTGIYTGPAKLWKRMGLAVHEGRRQGNGGPGAPSALYKAFGPHAYNKDRRSVAWNIGETLIKAKRFNDGYYRVYAAQKLKYQTKNAEGGYAERAAKLLKECPGASAASKKAWKKGQLTKGHIAGMAHRYMTKRFLRDYWRAWQVAVGLSGKPELLAAE